MGIDRVKPSVARARWGLLMVTAALSGCSLLPWQSSRFGGETSEVFFLEVGRSSAREINYTLRLGENPADVFFAFVNYDESGTQVPRVEPLPASSVLRAGDEVKARSVQAAPGPESARNGRHKPAIITEFNNKPPAMVPGGSGARRSISAPLVSRAGEAVGATARFYQYAGTFDNPVLTWATLRAVVDDGAGRTLNVWVADEEFEDANASSTGKITPDKVTALADAFLLPGESNDIHDRVTTIVGEPWGPHDYVNLIGPEYADTIDIFLVDILRDGESDGVLGYFWGKDNYVRTSTGEQLTDQSNERIIFYLDAVIYGQLDGFTWSVDDSWPQLVLSTLAHEFQHMIHFYEKTVLRSEGRESETWLNEMMSLVIEDFLSVEMGVPGPRGVDPVLNPAGDGGDPGIRDGRLGEFNADNDTGIYSWVQSDPSANYAVNYARGAFLARNYGGASFVRAVVQNEFTGRDAIEAALDALRMRVTYRESMSQWAAAVLVSDETIVPWDGGNLDSVYNAGGWFESSIDGVLYRLGSINLYNHEVVDGGTVLSGPRVFTGTSVGTATVRPGGSVVYYQGGSGLTGSHEWSLSIGPHTDVVVVAKAAM